MTVANTLRLINWSVGRWVLRFSLCLLIGLSCGVWSARADCKAVNAWGTLTSQCLSGDPCKIVCGATLEYCITYSCNGYNNCMTKGGTLTECNVCPFRHGCDTTGC
jgi:hypothetical protein